MKTPIQELFEECGAELCLIPIDEWIQKEKAFAFDCYQAGYSEIFACAEQTVKEDFDDFYSEYATQYNK